MDAIKSWLNSSRDYSIGVALYLKYGDDADYRHLFRSEARTAFKERKLEELLDQLYRKSLEPLPEKVQAVVSVQQAPFTQHKYWPAQPIEDKVVDALWRQWRPLYSEMMSLQARVHDVALQGATDPNKLIDAGQMALKILQLDDKVEWIYAQRNYYQEHGRLPEEPKQEAEEVVDPVRWATELQNNERYVREYKLKLKNQPAHKNAAKWAMKLKEKSDLVAHFRKQLNLD